MKEAGQVALLVDVVSSRVGDRRALHRSLLAAAEATNARWPGDQALHPTVADEMQGVYPTLGAALGAAFTLRLSLLPDRDVRCGVGGGEVTVIDPERDIQDGAGWWLAREAVDWVAAQAQRKGFASARTAIRDGRPGAIPQADALVRLVDSRLAQLSDAALGTLAGLWAGLDNAAIARREGITPSANSQRVLGNDLRPLVEAMAALSTLP